MSILRAMWPLLVFVPALLAGAAAVASTVMALVVRRPAGGISPERRIESSSYGIFALVALLLTALLLAVGLALLLTQAVLHDALPPRGVGGGLD